MNTADLKPHERVVDGVVAHRYRGEYADHALVIGRTAGTDVSIARNFCAHHANRGAEMWFVDERIPTPAGLAPHVARTSGLPVFVMCSSADMPALYRALPDFDFPWGAIVIAESGPVHSWVHNSIRDWSLPTLYVTADAGLPSGLTDEHVEVARLFPRCSEQSVLAHPMLSDIVLEWCVRQLANHFNPQWRVA